MHGWEQWKKSSNLLWLDHPYMEGGEEYLLVSCWMLGRETLVGCWSFTFWQHRRSYQDRYQLVAVCTHGNFTVLPSWKTRPPVGPMTQSYYPDTEPTSPCPILIMLSVRLGGYKYQLLSHWSDMTRFRTHEALIPRSSKTGDGYSTNLATPTGLEDGDWKELVYYQMQGSESE